MVRWPFEPPADNNTENTAKNITILRQFGNFKMGVTYYRVYSKVPNKRTGPNKSTGGKFCQI